ncbi:hypothetical protein [Izhakiella capsodis]|uniref:hypothetical protein n=1 Tax=Izhakiella capsodis TaxID=1367852 RepID=UPI000B884F5C|nr:hypothetical protein [Izhakiella capsodis]
MNIIHRCNHSNAITLNNDNGYSFFITVSLPYQQNMNNARFNYPAQRFVQCWLSPDVAFAPAVRAATPDEVGPMVSEGAVIIARLFLMDAGNRSLTVCRIPNSPIILSLINLFFCECLYA